LSIYQKFTLTSSLGVIVWGQTYKIHLTTNLATIKLQQNCYEIVNEIGSISSSFKEIDYKNPIPFLS